MLLNDLKTLEIPLQKIIDPLLQKYGVQLFIKREDLTHPQISGNKWYKLKYNLVEAQEKKYDTLLTFGGSFSNHIYAAAAAGKIFNFKTIGIIRGEEHLPLNYTLKFAADSGMQIYYCDRKKYRHKNDNIFIDELHNKFGNFYLIPEGGTNELAVKGAAEIPTGIQIPFDYICSACGTGGTISGIISGLNGKEKAIGFAVLKGAGFLIDEVKRLTNNSSFSQYNNWSINLDYHFGGYAKITSELVYFIDRFYDLHEILLEPIYTGKMMYGIYNLTAKNYFKRGETIIAVHTGGLQGLNGMQTKINRLRRTNI